MPPALFTKTPLTPGLKPSTAPVAQPGASASYFSLLGYTGPANISGYAGVFPMLNWSGDGPGQPGTATSSGQPRLVSIQRQIDGGSPFLAQACAAGKFFVQVTVLSVSQGNTTVRARLAKVVISGYVTSSSGPGIATESLTLDYASGSFF